MAGEEGRDAFAARVPGRMRRGRPFRLVVVLALALVPTFFVPCGAGGATRQTLEQKASAIASAITADNTRLAAIGTAYLRAKAAFAADQHEQSVLHAAVVRARRRARAAFADLRRAAIVAYVSGGSVQGVGVPLTGNPNELDTSRAYLQVATGSLEAAMTSYERARAALGAKLRRTEHVGDEERRAIEQASATRAEVLHGLEAEQALLVSTNSALERLIAEQEAARQAAIELAAQKVAAARAAAAAAAGPPSSTATASAAASSSSSTTPAASSSLVQQMAELRNCESGDIYTLNTGNGYYGAYQFSLSTWESLGQSGLPSAAAPPVQDATAIKLYDESGWSSWPECSAILGL